MNCDIITFHFAHNYGAVLQAYALKKYLNGVGCNARIVDYTPEHLKKFYSKNPFSTGKRPNVVIKRIVQIKKDWNQFGKFTRFISTELLGGYDSNYKADVLLCGSDQIWNNEITGNINNYYIGTEDYKTIASYAASFGSSELNDFQKSCIKEYLPKYEKVSLRESDLVETTAEISGREVVSVVDPVLLVSRQEWHNFAQNSTRKNDEKYILYYALRNDDILKKKAEKLAEKCGAKVVCIHPTGKDLNTSFTQLYDVGPYEFVNLIENAEYVVTNSFHAMAFSVIFGKKAAYKAYSKTESRVPGLLNLCNGDSCYQMEDDVYDFSFVEEAVLENKIAQSKDFLASVLNS